MIVFTHNSCDLKESDEFRQLTYIIKELNIKRIE